MAKNNNGKFVRKERFSYQNKALKNCVIIQNSSLSIMSKDDKVPIEINGNLHFSQHWDGETS